MLVESQIRRAEAAVFKFYNTWSNLATQGTITSLTGTLNVDTDVTE